MILNELEASLHPDLMAPLARLILVASRHARMIVVTHAPALVAALSASGDRESFALEKQFGETIARDRDPARGAWPTR